MTIDAAAYQRQLAKDMSEDELQTNVIYAARRLGYLVHHSRPGMTKDGRWVTPIQGNAGLVDIILVGHGRVLWCELKREDGRLRPAQIEWRDALQAAGCEWHLFRPSSWLSGDVERVLRGEEAA